jgi:hypothetical protein
MDSRVAFLGCRERVPSPLRLTRGLSARPRRSYPKSVRRSAAVHAMSQLTLEPLCGLDARLPWSWTSVRGAVTCRACLRMLAEQDLRAGWGGPEAEA